MPSLSSPSPPESPTNTEEARAGKGSAMRSHPLRGRRARERGLVKKGKGQSAREEGLSQDDPWG